MIQLNQVKNLTIDRLREFKNILISVSKKRKLSIDNNVSSNNLLNNISTISVEDESIDKNGTSQSFNSSQISQVSSPWEVRRLKADVIDYSSRVSNI